MTYARFEDVPVWQKAVDLYQATEKFLQDRSLSASRSFCHQLEHAALAVSNHIAEGFECGSTRELLNFIYRARGSAGAVRSMLVIQQRRTRDRQLHDQLQKLLALTENCSRQLRAWAQSLQDATTRGQRYLGEQNRMAEEQKRRAAACQKELLRRLPESHPLRQSARERGLA